MSVKYIKWTPNESKEFGGLPTLLRCFAFDLSECDLSFCLILNLEKSIDNYEKKDFEGLIVNNKPDVHLFASLVNIEEVSKLKFFSEIGFSVLDFFRNDGVDYVRFVLFTDRFKEIVYSSQECTEALFIRLCSCYDAKQVLSTNFFSSEDCTVAGIGCTIDVSDFQATYKYVSGFFSYGALEKLPKERNICAEETNAVRATLDYYEAREAGDAATILGYLPNVTLVLYRNEQKGLGDDKIEGIIGESLRMSGEDLLILNAKTERNLIHKLACETHTNERLWSYWGRCYYLLARAEQKLYKHGVWLHIVTTLPGFSDKRRNKTGCVFSTLICNNIKESLERVRYFNLLMGANISMRLLLRAQTIIRVAQIKSAIGSIMSRNGSHNIGSHVLAALSHNVGTMPDDRVLYQYIQQRMDYIANVTTEAPSWSQPTMFLGDIMRTFLSQRHLLSHIAESEGLGAWEFQNKNMDDLMAHGQHDKLRFQIRRRFKNEKNCGVNYTSVIGYENNGATIDFQDDIALAIPGGIAGQHAFFTIIENIVRNAAKHDWSNPPKKTEAFKKKDKGQDDDGRYGNLNIYIDYEDKELDGCVEFTIWTNMSDVLEHVDDGKGCDSKKAMHNILSKKLDAQFIDEKTGGLRRENWGLAEMRISAGYLQGNNISEIGGIDKPAKPIIQATVHNEDGINHLAYRFCVPKPKRMLILVDDDRSNRTECEKVRLQEVLKKYRNQASECKKFGLYVKTYTEIKAECSDKKKPKLNYEYVVMDDMREEQASWYLPFRVLSIKQTEVAGAKDLVPTMGGYASCLDIIEDVTESKGRKSNIESNIQLVEEAIYSSWCSYIKSRQIEKNTALNLILSVKNDSSGNEGRGLISKRDVVKFVFEESFNSAVRSYIKLNKLSEASDAYIALNALKEKRRGVVELDKMEGNDYKGLIMRCFQSFCAPTNSVTREESRITKEIAKVKSDKKTKEKFRTKRLAELRKELDEARNKTQEEVGRGIGAYGGFLDYIEKVCEQMETILCKYAENVVTLPSGFRSDGVGVVEETGKVWDAAAVGWWKGPRPSDDALGSVGLDVKAPTIEFIRHYHPEDKDDQPENRLYAEPLSGSQSYLNMLEKCSFSDKATIVKLVETALLRVLVIDERVAKFLREHKDEVSQTYKSMRIYVADDKKVDEELQMLQSKSDKSGVRKLKAFRWCKPQLDSLLVPLSSYNIYEGRKVLQAEAARPVDRKLQNKFTKYGKKLFDVLIVHQGIIDKWFPATANSPETVEKLLCYLRQIFPYVIITTGRGSPANIPETARMLPFSTVEATLFRKYPEKLLLMDSVMNIVPKGESSYE